MQKKVHRKLNKKALLVIILTLYLFIMAFYYCFNLPIKSIVIKGNTNTLDEEIIKLGNINSYNKILGLNTKKVKNDIMENKAITSVKIKKQLNGTLLINVKEQNILFYNLLNKITSLIHNTIRKLGEIMDIFNIVNKLKKETNNLSDIIYREKNIGKTKVFIIYNEPLTSKNDISDFIIRSLNTIEKTNNKIKNEELVNIILNDISNYKVEKVKTYSELCSYLHKGFTIILISDTKYALVLETKANLNRGIAPPEVENTIRGAKDSFIENYQTNIGLIKRRVKTNDLWIDNISLGKYTDTQIGIVYVNNICKKELVDKIKRKLETIDIYGVINAGIIKNLLIKENNFLLPTVITTERPDIVASSILEGKIALVIDNSPFVIIIPGVFADFFKTPEDDYNRSFNASFTRIIKYISFFIALLTPSIYIALITYNHEMIPTELLISFAIQRDGVPFPAFFEAFIMMTSFEILRESDLRNPKGGSALSIVGALILGEAAVNAGIVSPIMIIIIAITAICSLPFTEPELTNGLRWYRILFMLGGSFLGIIGVIIVFLFFIIKTSSVYSFGIPYMTPYVPTYLNSLKNSIIKFPFKKLTKRDSYLSNNTIKERIRGNNENKE